MSVVDDDAERLAAVDSFHPAGDALHRRQPLEDERTVQVQGLAQGHASQGVVNVEPAGQPQVHLARPAGSGDV